MTQGITLNLTDEQLKAADQQRKTSWLAIITSGGIDIAVTCFTTLLALALGIGFVALQTNVKAVELVAGAETTLIALVIISILVNVFLSVVVKGVWFLVTNAPSLRLK